MKSLYLKKKNQKSLDKFVEAVDADLIGVKLVDLDMLLKESDVIDIHANLTDETRSLIGEREIGLMKKSAIIVNDARGEIINMPALAKALEEGRIYGAGIDVWPKEPPDPNESWVQSIIRSKLTSLSSHTGTVNEAMVFRHRAALENIERFCKGQRPQWVVN